ncbi:MAG: glycosyltransferase [Magnetococcales bacterium]|nr:glycosyltransferase [Magnetococcales bacterium]
MNRQPSRINDNLMKKILIFIVAYNAEKTIQTVLNRIPDTLDKANTEVLIIDDSSQDRTFEMARQYAQQARSPFRITVLYNPVNLGYGGNQKVGFYYAIQHGFDIVALVHGDGQYAPEALPELLLPLLADQADAVFGSRMLQRGAARKGGMPFYKFLGNKVLTGLQNRLLGSSLSEFHSGYRLYSIHALRAIPFHLNTPDFHFDTEIIIQLMRAGMRIEEIPIPTYYGDEICHVNGVQYAWNVCKSTLLARIQQYDLLYQQKFDIQCLNRPKDHYPAKLTFISSHTLSLQAIPPGARVLDVGCAGGHIAQAIRESGGHVVGIDRNRPEDASQLDLFIQADLEADPFPLSLESFDRVLLMDVIEHLGNPEAFMHRLSHAAINAPGVRIIVTTGNVAFFVIRIMLLMGHFNYGKRGILDLDHKRLFTFKSMRNLLEQCGFTVQKVVGIPAPFPMVFGSGVIGRALLSLNRILIRLSRGVFSYQIYMEATPTPKLEDHLTMAIEESKKRVGPDPG